MNAINFMKKSLFDSLIVVNRLDDTTHIEQVQNQETNNNFLMHEVKQ